MFSHNKEDVKLFSTHANCGGMTVNDCLMHYLGIFFIRKPKYVNQKFLLFTKKKLNLVFSYCTSLCAAPNSFNFFINVFLFL